MLVKRDSELTQNVAVLISVYQEDTPVRIYYAIQSLLNQTYENLHIYIMTDGAVSSDCEKLLKFYATNPRCSVFYNQKNSGLAVSMNQLIDIVLAREPNVSYISRMDADDICFLSRISQQVKFMENNPQVEVLGGGCIEFGVYNKLILKYESDREIKKSIFKTTPFIHPTVTFRSSVFKKGYRYPTNTTLTEDLSLWLQLAEGGLIFHNLQIPLIYYRLTDKTLVRRTGVRKATSELKTRLKYLKKLNQPVIINLLYCLAHFLLRTLPLKLVKIIYSIMR